MFDPATIAILRRYGILGPVLGGVLLRPANTNHRSKPKSQRNTNAAQRSLSSVGVRKTSTGLPNKVPDALIPKLARPVRARPRARQSPLRQAGGINSGYRSPAVNKAVGSKPSSQHARGEAADIEVPGVSNLDVARWIKTNLSVDQLILEAHKPGQPSGGWVHVSWVPNGRRNQATTMTMGSHGPVYMQGLPK